MDPRQVIDLISDELICALCQDLLSEPVSLIPCLHTFCSFCTSRYTTHNIETETFICPVCREEVQDTHQNFMVQSIVEACRKVESKKRDGSGVLSPQHEPTPEPKPLSLWAKAFQEIEQEASQNAPNADSQEHGTPVPDTTIASVPCRSCQPGNPTGYACPNPIPEDGTTEPPQNHIKCAHCHELMPARGEDNTLPGINQACSFCGIIACDEYWGCRDTETEFKICLLKGTYYVLSNCIIDLLSLDLRVVDSFLEKSELLEFPEEGHLNTVELEYLQDYMDLEDFVWKDVWKVCLDMIDLGEQVCPFVRRLSPAASRFFRLQEDTIKDWALLASGSQDDTRPKLTEQLRACFSCAINIINGQVFRYWQNIDDDQLPAHVLNREPCPHGPECITQWRNPSHARRLAHRHPPLLTEEYDTTSDF
ncbi:hypothetical protein BCR43DRAFT_492997 [Syncephalastrum racemosum]|uniref:RING-type domain-containing protein n=1 Tax=Syncephalastrum racemosum TaxID=13706 RepID=A0A1X2H9T2_SYNRA|nr:hypothetical protein BCR43DRAFT_492997 [Syncephalastrum racemosum]